MAGGGFGVYKSGGGGGGGISSVTIQNTVYVAKNGDDATGAVDDLTKPFLTIAAASAAADAQDCVYVYRGSYTETSADTFVNNVYYYLEPNVEVINDTNTLIGDSEGNPKNISIFGYGNLTCLLQKIINLQEIASTIRLECNNLTSANEIMSFNGANFQIDCNDISFQGIGFTLTGAPTSDCYLNFNECICTDSATTTWSIGHAAKTITLRGRQYTQDFARDGGSPFKTVMSSTARLIVEIDQFIAVSGGTSAIFETTGGGVMIKNMLKKGGASITMGASPQVDFYNCQLKSTANIFEMTQAGVFNLYNCLLYASIGTITTMTGTCVLNLVDCVIQVENQNCPIQITQTGEEEGINPVLVLQNVTIYNLTGGVSPFCIKGTLNGSDPANPIPIYNQGNLTATQNIDTATITNAISGNAIVVNTSLQISSNFLKTF
jgi:hypothetical protein